MTRRRDADDVISLNSGSLDSDGESSMRSRSRSRSPSSRRSSSRSRSRSRSSSRRRRRPIRSVRNYLFREKKKKEERGVDRFLGNPNEIIYVTRDPNKHKIIFRKKKGKFKRNKIPNKACSYLLSHCAKRHPLMSENKKHEAVITIKKRKKILR
jgi:hypothetical protein